jgi:DNA-binding transcriptional ArsR family regulator
MSTNETDTRTSRSDPERIRALAHPLRLALLEFLADTGEATATQCAQHTGESVANCSFHLRLLARYGFIEPAEPRGRERPWRPSDRREQFVPDESVPGSVRAVVELAEVAAHQEIESFIGFLHQRADRADELAGRPLPTSMTKDAFWATPDETDALLEAVGALIAPYAARTKDPSTRPAGALLMRWFATSHPDLAVDPAPGPEASDAPHPLAPSTPEEA